MTKPSKTAFVCQQCGNAAPKWAGRCPGCGGWNTLVEERVVAQPKGRPVRSRATPIALLDVPADEEQRLVTGLSEFDRVLGGGIVRGSLILLGGEPGIGKSSLLGQVSALVSQRGPVLYVTGEESPAQVKLRARRLGVERADIRLLAETDVDSIVEHLRDLQPVLAVVDSIQTMSSSDIGSAAGSVSQLRESAARFLEAAKSLGVPIFLVGHVTKDGAIAGPRVLEHMVDAVLYLEGDRFHAFRILRATKDRFGSTDEVGVFEMGEAGLTEVRNPSQVFLEERGAAAGSVVVPTLEGTRPLLVEIQALVSPTAFGLPRRTVSGVDMNRTLVLLAVLAKRAGIGLGAHDVYVSLAGGLRVREPAADLGVAAAMASAYRDRACQTGTVLIGEVGLSGEVRRVSRIASRLAEARSLGFTRAIVPKGNLADVASDGLTVEGVATLREALSKIALSD
ncbi:MAG: DNA repair protein RadA [Chloroflexi bacterium 13_1_40CM_4_68_4]|nr:MAG: DNA repair protein RadA [Chloroflexi bacterium 13_1_40CM_4_68_4]